MRLARLRHTPTRPRGSPRFVPRDHDAEPDQSSDALFEAEDAEDAEDMAAPLSAPRLG